MIMAGCKFCHKEFEISPRHIRLKNRHHHCLEAERDYKREKNRQMNLARNKVAVLASCRWCHKEFTTSYGRITCGCPASKEFARQYHNLCKKKDFNLTRKVKHAPKRGNKSPRIMDGLHLCPSCRITLTANRIKCDRCWARDTEGYDVDALMTWDTGQSRRVVTNYSNRKYHY